MTVRRVFAILLWTLTLMTTFWAGTVYTETRCGWTPYVPFQSGTGQ